MKKLENDKSIWGGGGGGGGISLQQKGQSVFHEGREAIYRRRTDNISCPSLKKNN